ncbi:Uncharacterized protein QJS10_CPB15g01125 [Acorus calamus]|uniref:25S rRNA (uridine-N(3))-methyltransferase BMT5-like domain-containing protein n=1 Tax=Acorus calamus TaxID=4465 RepID=A0AAV9D7Q3_ACOCL|nr:Uncharacterized protein QJS10_CPB15g01125 [Acorus calamus]
MGDQLLIPKDGQVVRSIKHYQSCQKNLLVGEGDFSFSACLARVFRSAFNITATSLDSEDELVTKHWSSVAHIEELERLGCEILHEIDVHNMHVVPCLIGREFDRIIFNFPHAGHFHFYRERDMWLIE